MRRLIQVGCLSALAFAVLTAGFMAGAGDAVRSVQGAASVNVTATDSSCSLSKKTLGGAGSVTFHVLNRGKFAHAFSIAGKRTKVLAPGRSQNMTLSLKAGKHPYLCTSPGHGRGVGGTMLVRS